MNITPTINVSSRSAAEEALKKLLVITPAWVQFDVSDGEFSEVVTWNNPKEALELVHEIMPKAYVEVHLMVNNQKEQAFAWIDAGVHRVIVHVEALAPDDFFAIQEYAEQNGVYCMVALGPTTDPHELHNYEIFSEVLILSVSPGPSGQKFKTRMKEVIKEICEEHPNAYIEVDGGITPDIAGQLERIGVDCVAVGAYLTRAVDITKAYKDFE